MDDKFLTVEEVADILRCSVATVRRYLRNGTLVGVRLENVWIVSEEDLAKFIESRKNKKTTD